MIYGPLSTGPAGPGRAPFGITKSKERKENIWIEALKKTIRTALKGFMGLQVLQNLGFPPFLMECKHGPELSAEDEILSQ